jgi:hypothetical protein
MKKAFPIIALAVLLACNNSKKEPSTGNNDIKSTEQQVESSTPTTSKVSSSNTNFIIDGKEIKTSGSLLVQKDKDKLKPGNDFLVMLTSSGGPNKEGLTLNYLMDLKAGTYPIVGMSLTRGLSENGEVYGGILGGKPKLTNYNVVITECKDLGSNGLGGHKWSISGSFDELVIPAMGIMLLDKEKNHPKEVKIEKGSFSNLTFDDNWEEMFEKGMEQLKKNK